MNALLQQLTGRPIGVILLRLALLAAILSGALSWLSGPAHAQQQGDLRVTASLGYDGYFRDGQWVPVWISVQNTGASDFEGEIRIQIDGTYGGTPTVFIRPLELAAGASRDLTLPIAMSGYSSSLNVDIFAGDQRVSRSNIRRLAVTANDLVYGVVAASPDAFSGLGTIKPYNGSGYVAQVGINQLPENPLLLNSLDVLVFSDVDTGVLSAGQRAALSTWVNQGGRLWVMGGPNWQRTVSGLADLLPVRLTGTETVTDASGLAGFSLDGSAPNGSLTAATGTLDANAVVRARAGGVPFLIERRAGMGQVLFFAADSAVEPLSSWSGMDDLYRLLMSQAIERPSWTSGVTVNTAAANDAAVNIPDLELISPFLICGLLGAYVALVGPLNYLALRVLKRRELAWLTIPATVVVFSCLAYVIGFVFAGRQPLLHEVAVVQGPSGATAGRVDMAIGLYSPVRTAYNLAFPTSVLARPMPNVSTIAASDGQRVVVGDQFELRGVATDISGVASFLVQGSAPVPQIDSEWTLEERPGGVRVQGSVTNTSQITFSDAVLLFPGAVERIGDFAPGQRHTFSLFVSGGRATSAPINAVAPPGGALPGAAASPYGPGYYYDSTIDDILGTSNYSYWDDSDSLRRYSILSALGDNYNSLSRGSGVYLSAWAEDRLFDVRVTNAGFRTQSLQAYLIQLPRVVRATARADGVIILRPEAMTWQMLPSNVNSSGYGPYDFSLYTNESMAALFQPSEPITFDDVLRLTLTINDASGQTGTPNDRFLLWSVADEDWVELPGVSFGENEISDPGRFVGPSGEVRVRVDSLPSSSGYSSYERVDVTLEVR